ncbi:MAG: nicotinate (nicotinamide) nucleotide adenylyltransferase [Bacteroidia bacterium]
MPNKHKKNIGLFFGTFNPVHIGHMVIASYMAEFAGLDEVWMVVSPHNPLKEKASLLDDYQRLYMVNLAIDNHPKLRASNIEFKLSQPSYTIHTLTHLMEKYPEYHFALIMGSDNLENFHKWKNYERILELSSLIVYPRPGYDGGDFKNHPSVKWVDAPLMQISSTFIRNALKDKKQLDFIVPDKVLKYIKEMHFYEK